MIKLDQKENHAHHNGDKDQILHHVRCHQGCHGSVIPHVLLQVVRKVEHASLSFAQREGDECRGNEKQKGRLDDDGPLRA